MGANAHSAAALGIYEGQPDGMPPSAVDQMGIDGRRKKKGKRRKKRDQMPVPDY